MESALLTLERWFDKLVKRGMLAIAAPIPLVALGLIVLLFAEKISQKYSELLGYAGVGFVVFGGSVMSVAVAAFVINHMRQSAGNVGRTVASKSKATPSIATSKKSASGSFMPMTPFPSPVGEPQPVAAKESD
ncbi:MULTISPECIES: hypothetical protein [unclassified Azospirillum]|jgi:uncharacterized membrane protein|uniref:hypothetical protein n=1 Tax=unclassified Azospirillum TaxID=2630922 RepID=UPI00117761E7|nr:MULTISPECIES: hypothetical protein [unclassified Azospirillum]